MGGGFSNPLAGDAVRWRSRSKQVSSEPTSTRISVPALPLCQAIPSNGSPSASLRRASVTRISEGSTGHPKSARAGGKLEQIKTTVLEDPTVLRDPQWCAAFSRYLTEAYESDLIGDEHEPHRIKLAKKLQKTALVFFDFWADLSDLEWCHMPSDFSSLRLETILEKYLSRGAQTPVPLSISVRSSLLGEDGAGDVSSLNEARYEAFRYLASEVLPLFVSSRSPLGLPACLYKTKRVVWTLEDDAKKLVGYPEGMNIMVRVAPSQAFYEFMKSKDEALGRMVMICVEILGFKSLADHWGLQRWRQKHNHRDRGSRDDLRPAESPAIDAEAMLQARFEITTAHDIFDNHLRLGRPIRAMLPPAIMQTLLSSASCPDAGMGGGALPPTLFDEVLVYLLNHLNGYLNEFHRSSAYARLIKPKEKMEELSEEALNLQREELNMLFRSLIFKSAFRSYLASQEDKQAAWLYRFYQDVTELRTCPMDVPLMMFTRVTKVYLTYVRRGTPHELAIFSGAPRIRTIERLILPGALSDRTVYDAAQAKAFDTLATQASFSPGSWLSEEAEAATPRQTQEQQGGSASGSAPQMSAILGSSSALAAFGTFAASELLANPLHFWLEAEEFRTLPRTDLLIARSRTIVRKYVTSDASRTVPLSEAVRDRILECCELGMVGPGLFLEAQMQVYQWMKTELLPHFIKTPAGQALNSRQKPKAGTKGLVAVNSRGGTGDSSPGRRVPALAAIPSLTRQWSMDSDAPASARESTFEDVMEILDESRHGDSKQLIVRLLKVPIALQFFAQFCKECGAYKHLAFFLDAEEFRKQLPGHESFRRSQAKKLYNKYLADDAVMKVPIRHTTQKALQHRLGNPDRSIFNEAQDEALSFLSTGLLQDFLGSPELKAMVDANGLGRMTPWRRLSRSLSSTFRRATTQTGDTQQTENNSARSSNNSEVGTLSSPMAMDDSLGMGDREPRDVAHWSQKLSAGFRAVLTGGKSKDLKHSQSEGIESSLGLQRRLELDRSPMGRRSYSSDGSGASLDRDSLRSNSDDGPFDADLLLKSLHGTLDGKSESLRNPGARTSTATVLSVRGVALPGWRSPGTGRGVPIVPMGDSEENRNIQT